MRKQLLLCVAASMALAACSPRDFLSRRLAADLISTSDLFKAPQQFVLQTGVISAQDYSSSDYLVLQRHGWILAHSVACRPGLTPPPCWDIVLTPSGVDTIRTLVPGDDPDQSSIALPVARRQLVAITGISKTGNIADVEFAWKWVPLNEVGAALYSGDLRYRSTVRFREFDDGWRIAQGTAHPPQNMDDALKNAEPLP